MPYFINQLLMDICVFILGGIMNNAARNILIQVFVKVCVLLSFEYKILQSKIGESYGNSMYNILRNLLNYFPKGLHHFTCSPAYMKVPISPHPQHHLVLLFFIYTHSSGCEVASHCGFDLHFPDE